MAGAAALAAVGLTAAAAHASPDPQFPVRDGKNISVFHQIDFVGAFGYAVGQPLSVEVLRGTHRIGDVSTFAVPTPEGGGLEINHGVEGTTPSEGDCWSGATPDIRPYDRIVVTDMRGHKDAILVDDIGVGSGPVAVPEGVVFTGWARSALPGDAPIDLGRMEGESRLDKFRPVSNAFTAEAGAPGGFRLLYPNAVLGGAAGVATMLQPGTEHMIGFGHAPIELPDGTEELQTETQIFDVGGVAGPAQGCEALAPAAGHDAATALDTDMLTAATTDGLDVSGTAAADVTRVDVTAADSAGGVATASTSIVEAAPNAPAGSPLGWTAQIPQSEIDELAPQATLSVTATFTTADGTTRPATGPSLRIVRDVQAPDAPTATPGPGELEPGRTVRLRAEPGARIHFTVDGSEPGLSSERYSLPIPIDGATTIRAIAVDGAGNVSAASSMSFTVRPAPAAPPAAPAPPAVATPALVPGLGSAHASALRVAGVSVRSSRVSLRQARREGLVVRFVGPRGAGYAEARLVRLGADGARRVVATKLMIAAGGRQLARFTGAGVRRKLSRGRYAVEVRAGEAPTRLGAPATKLVRIG